MKAPGPSFDHAPFALLLNGSINSGKTTVARTLRVLHPRLAHVEVDTLGDFLPSLPSEERFALNLKNGALVARTLLDAGHPLVLSYPLTAAQHAELTQALAPYPIFTFTLAPPLDIALSDRGSRALTTWEQQRIRHHYATGLPRPGFGTVIDNAGESPATTAHRILAAVGLTPPTPILRSATVDDAPAIARIHVETWRFAYRKILPADFLAGLSIEKRTQGWRKNLSEKRDSVWVAELAGTVVGWVSFGPCRDDGEGEAEQGEIYALYLDAPFQRSGLGQALMSAAERQLVSFLPQARRISLWVLQQNEPARRFYARFGYATGSREKAVPIGGESFTEVRYEKFRPTAP